MFLEQRLLGHDRVRIVSRVGSVRVIFALAALSLPGLPAVAAAPRGRTMRALPSTAQVLQALARRERSIRSVEARGVANFPAGGGDQKRCSGDLHMTVAFWARAQRYRLEGATFPVQDTSGVQGVKRYVATFDGAHSYYYGGPGGAALRRAVGQETRGRTPTPMADEPGGGDVLEWLDLAHLLAPGGRARSSNRLEIERCRAKVEGYEQVGGVRCVRVGCETDGCGGESMFRVRRSWWFAPSRGWMLMKDETRDDPCSRAAPQVRLWRRTVTHLAKEAAPGIWIPIYSTREMEKLTLADGRATRRTVRDWKVKSVKVNIDIPETVFGPPWPYGTKVRDVPSK